MTLLIIAFAALIILSYIWYANIISKGNRLNEELSQDAAFKIYYDEYILPHIRGYEPTRQKMVKRFIYVIQFCIMLSLLGLIYIYYIFLYSVISINLIALIFVAACSMYVIYTKSILKYQKEVAQNIYPIILGYFDKAVLYTRQQTIDNNTLKMWCINHQSKAVDDNELKRLCINNRFDTVYGQEYFKLTHDNITIEVKVIPGEFRDRDVAVGRHIAISGPAVPRFLKRFEEVYSKLGKTETIIAAAAAHHRLIWIHPVLDGNGRVARLMSHATLLETLDTGGIWSISRGLALNVDAYKRHLAACDQSRRNDLDGREHLA